MPIHERCLTEQEAVDYALGIHSGLNHQTLTEHLEHCTDCMLLVNQWSELTVTASGKAGRNALEPTLRLKRKLLFRARLHAMQLYLNNHKRLMVASLFILLCSTALLTIPQLLKDNHVPTNENLLTGNLVQGMHVVLSPQSAKYELTGTGSTPLQGRVWVNASEGDLMMMLEGVEPSNENDLQVWIVRGNEDTQTIGLLQFVSGKAQLYFHGGYLKNSLKLSVSREPKGGSLHPSTPELASVRINAN